MQIRVHSEAPRGDADLVVVVPYSEHDDLGDVPRLSEMGGSALQDVLRRGVLRAKLYDHTLVPSDEGQPDLLFVGAGSKGELTPLIFSRVAAAASRYVTGRGYERLAILDRGILEPEQFAQAAVEGAIAGSYNAGVRKTRVEHRRELQEIALISARDGQELEQGVRTGEAVGEARSLARDLVNLPPNDITPTSLAERAASLAQEYGLGFESLDEQAMRQRGMGALLGVSAGSAEPARVIILRYGDDQAPIKLAFVGKGLTFDSGGLSLKTAEGMETMKSDMSGAAAVIAGMTAIARLAPHGLSVRGYVGATENMPGGAAMRPGDVLTAMTGETIEVLNTDAEGRLVLADVLALAESEGATHMVDFATLTGGAVVALGRAATLAAGKPSRWVADVVACAEAGLERAWQMPIYDEYRRAMDSDVADIKNSGGREASALTASAFLADFVKKAEWAHMDIAGTAFGKATPFRAPGATGEGVGTIAALCLSLAGESVGERGVE